MDDTRSIKTGAALSNSLLSFRIDDDLRERVNAAAASHEAGVSGLVRDIIARALETQVPIEDADLKASEKAIEAVRDAERVEVAARRTLDNMRDGLERARAARDELLKEREPHAFRAKAEGSAEAQEALDAIAEKLRATELEVSDFTAALATAERQLNAAADVLKRAKADAGLLAAQMIRTELIACSREFDGAIVAAVNALRKREALRVKLLKTGAAAHLPTNRLVSPVRINRALGMLGLAAFANIPDAAHTAHLQTLEESDSATLSGLRRTNPDTEAA